ncbi:probable 54S ribosomal protein L27,mitochondrial [Zygosaccharomyces bailii ISA1307]|nr:probable 54S ribosomal protein L27,mitochondrial [Zygosaccharomyces bailii ISA1307]
MDWPTQTLFNQFSNNVMKATAANLFHESPLALLTRPWKRYRDGTLFYGSSKTGNRRTPLTTKQGNKTMYKGTRSSGVGKHTRYGGYAINWDKVRTFVTPRDYNTELKPLVSHNVPELTHTFKGYSQGSLDPQLYFMKLREYIKNGRVPSEASDIDCHVERG